MEAQASPEFSDYIHAIARRKALLFGIAIPIAVLAILLSLTLPDIYTSSALVEIDEPSSAQSLAGRPATASPTTPTSTCRTSRASCSRTRTCASSTRSTTCIRSSPTTSPPMLKRLRRDIDVKIVTTPILDPRTGREREVVDAFTRLV